MFEDIIVLLIAGGLFLLFLSLASALRFLNFSQLQDKFRGDGYDALLTQLENRDAVELLAEFFAWAMGTFLALFYNIFTIG